MYLFFIFLILFVISAALTYLMKYRFEQTIAITCFAMIFVLYLFGVFGFMIVGVYTIIAASVCALIFFVWGIVKGFIKKDYIISNVLTPGFVVFCLFYVFLCAVHRDRVLINWDEFSHWGTVVRNMYSFDAFGNHPYATTLFQGYPPASALFHYFWMKITGYSEANFFISMGILYVSLFLPVLKNVYWNSKKLITLVALFIVLSVGFYTNVYVDVLLGFLLAYVLFAYFTEESFDIPYCINLALALFVLTLTKASGFGLAVIAALIIILDMVIKARKSKRDIIPEKDKPLKNRLTNLLASKAFRISAIAICIPLIANYSWSIYRHFTNTDFAWTDVDNITLSNLLEFISGGAEPYKYVVLQNFLGAIFNRNVSMGFLHFTYFQWVLLFGVVLFIWYRRSDEKLRSKIVNSSLGVFAGGILYVISLAVIYLFAFPEIESVPLASFDRYMNTYIFACMTSFFYFLFIYYVNDNVKFENKKKVTIITMFMVFYLSLFNINAFTNVVGTPYMGVRQEVTISRMSSLPLDYKTDTINYIHQNSAGIHHYVARYEMTPITVNRDWFWSIGPDYPPGDRHLWNVSVNEWLEILQKGYTYVYLESISDNFINEFGAAFENIEQIRNRTLFRVVERNGSVILVYVEL